MWKIELTPQYNQKEFQSGGTITIKKQMGQSQTKIEDWDNNGAKVKVRVGIKEWSRWGPE